ncbi:hypothetical protein KIN20_013425 [Parelaphostrongylus tenuis]|uniref:Uncharacterized protein n=1 Tax=Parelaphostrongylus tenuis TaxID=148309 RepID=A0AAD5MGN0_PARTN|nr:hypothetical protein KIN20_013425 [Parelaphostrongylus tenuis]
MIFMATLPLPPKEDFRVKKKKVFILNLRIASIIGDSWRSPLKSRPFSQNSLPARP